MQHALHNFFEVGDIMICKARKRSMCHTGRVRRKIVFKHAHDSDRPGNAQSTIQGPVVQSVVSLTSSLRVISLTVLADSIYNILIFFAEKM